MRTLRHLFGSALTVAALAGLTPAAQAQTPYNFSTLGNTYTEDLFTIANWSNLTAGATAIPFTGTTTGAVPASRFARVPTNTGAGLVTTSTVGATTLSQNAVFTATTAGGVQKVTVMPVSQPTVPAGITLPAIGLLATSTGNAVAMDQFLDFTGRNAGTLTFNWAQINNATGGRGGTLQVYTSTNGTTFTQLGSDITIFNNANTITPPAGFPSTGTFSQALPAGFNGSATARIRYYYHSVATPNNLGNNAGSRPLMAIDNIVNTATAAGGTPTFAAAASATTTITTKTVASPGVSVSFSGSNLTSDITATTTGPFGLSLTAGGPYTTSVTIPQNLSGSMFLNITSATAGNFTGSITYSGGGVATINPTSLSGKVLATQPASQPTLTASNATFNSIDLTVTGGTSQKYLIVGKTGTAATYVNTQIPTDGITYTASTAFGSGNGVGTAANFALSAGTATTITVTGFTSTTQYSFAVFAYNDDNTVTVENYLTAGFPTTAPSNANTAEAITLSPPPNIYLWVGAPGASYSVGTNWISQAGSAVGAGQSRTPAPEDILTFGSGTSTVLIDVATPVAQTIGGLVLGSTSNVTLTLDGATDRTLTVLGTVTGADVVVPAAATLNIRNNTLGGGLKLTLATPTTGTIDGAIDMNGASAVLTSDPVLTVSGTAGAVEVTSTGTITVGSFVTGTPIGGSTALIFRNGSTLTQNAGSSPTAAFEATSNLVWNQNGALSYSGRTYGNLTLLNHASAGQTGASPLVINNLTFSATGKTLSLNLTGGMTINGNINVTAGTLNFQPAGGTLNTLNLTSPTGTLTTVSSIAFTGTLNRANPATLLLNDVVIGAAGFTLGTNGNLNIARSLTFAGAGNITAGANTLTLLSTLAQTAFVVNTGAGTGTATVQRAVDGLTGINGLGYRHYSAPVTGATVNMLGSGTTPAVFNTAYNIAPTPTDGSVVPYPNVFAYDPTRVTTNSNPGFVRGYISPASGDPMTVGKGYSMHKDRSTVEMTGTLVTGTQNLPMNGDGTPGAFHGWNLLGNTYPSALDWSLVVVPANVGVVAFAIRPTSATGGVYVQYANVLAAANREMPMAQGFFLRKTNGAVITVPLTNAARVTTSDGNRPFNRSAQPVELMPTLHMTLGQPSDVIRPEVEVYFDATATNGLENLDGVVPGRSMGDAPTLLMLVGGTEVSVNRLAAFTGADVVVPVLVATPLAGTYKFDVSKLANFPAGTQVLLEDAITGRTQDLALSNSYSFYSDATYAGQRFTLRFTAGRVTGLSADLGANALSLFPNPASGTVRVSAPANATVRVFDAMGRLVRTARIGAAGQEISLGLDGLQAGFYTVRAGAASQKLVVE